MSIQYSHSDSSDTLTNLDGSRILHLSWRNHRRCVLGEWHTYLFHLYRSPLTGATWNAGGLLRRHRNGGHLAGTTEDWYAQLSSASKQLAWLSRGALALQSAEPESNRKAIAAGLRNVCFLKSIWRYRRQTPYNALHHCEYGKKRSHTSYRCWTPDSARNVRSRTRTFTRKVCYVQTGSNRPILQWSMQWTSLL